MVFQNKKLLVSSESKFVQKGTADLKIAGWKSIFKRYSFTRTDLLSFSAGLPKRFAYCKLWGNYHLISCKLHKSSTRHIFLSRIYSLLTVSPLFHVSLRYYPLFWPEHVRQRILQGPPIPVATNWQMTRVFKFPCKEGSETVWRGLEKVSRLSLILQSGKVFFWRYIFKSQQVWAIEVSRNALLTLAFYHDNS